MKKLLAIGEALVDIFDNNEVKVGGAPLNVCGAFSKLGGDTYFIGKLSTDSYGKLIKESIERWNIKSDYISYTDAYTGKAYVKTLANGERSFRFDRLNCADQLLQEDEIKEEWFTDAYALHFCSVSLANCPTKQAHYKAIEYARKHNCLISFDLNIRLSLFTNQEELKKVIFEFIEKADLIKLSIEELNWLNVNIKNLFIGNVKMILLTLGEDGSICYMENGRIIKSNGYKVDAIDTTGAGDGFIGSFLFMLSKHNKNIEKITNEEIKKYMEISNRFSSFAVQNKGAIDSYPTKEKMKRFIITDKKTPSSI